INGVLSALSVAGSVEVERPIETESSPNRSSYNTGPTGTRAFYQLLEESGLSVTRWRQDYKSLDDRAKNATLIIVGPFQFGSRISKEETRQLRSWVTKGGRLLIVSRSPRQQFGDTAIHSEYKEKTLPWETPAEHAVQIIDEKSDELIAQPTELTRNLRGLALSDFATRMKFYVDVAETELDQATSTPVPSPLSSPKSNPEAESKHSTGNGENGELPSPTPLPSPEMSQESSPQPSPD